MFVPFNEINSGSRIWIYQSSRPLDSAEESKIKEAGRQFATSWTAHKQNLLASFDILNHIFLVVAVDGSVNDASGCSIDKAFSFIMQLEKEFGISLLNRRALAYEQNGSIILSNLDEFEKLYKEGKISDQCIIYNNLVSTREQLGSKWRIPLHESWLMQLM